VRHAERVAPPREHRHRRGLLLQCIRSGSECRLFGTTSHAGDTRKESQRTTCVVASLLRMRRLLQ
jgi:hypothetical protein